MKIYDDQNAGTSGMFVHNDNTHKSIQKKKEKYYYWLNLMGSNWIYLFRWKFNYLELSLMAIFRFVRSFKKCQVLFYGWPLICQLNVNIKISLWTELTYHHKSWIGDIDNLWMKNLILMTKAKKKQTATPRMFIWKHCRWIRCMIYLFENGSCTLKSSGTA